MQTSNPIITKNVRITLTNDDWTEIRILAAENGLSVTAQISRIVEGAGSRSASVGMTSRTSS